MAIALSHAIVAVFIVAIIILLVLKFQPTDAKKRLTANAFRSASNGEADEAALLAMNTIEDIREKTPEDYQVYNAIVEQNILGGDIRTADADILGGLITGYERLINGIADRVAGRLKERAAPPRDIARGHVARAIDMLDRVTIHDDPVATDIWLMDNAEMFGERLRTVDKQTLRQVEPTIVRAFMGALANTSPDVRQKTIVERKVKSAESAVSRSDFSEKYLNAAVKYTDDKQNVHDNMVNRELRATFAKLRGSVNAEDSSAVIGKVRDYIMENTDTTNKRTDDAFRTLAAISHANSISSLTSSGTVTDRYVLAVMWARAEHPDNAAVEDKLKVAIVDALVDSVEYDIVVCVNGRCSHLINSGATIDADKSISSAKTYEMMKNEVYEEVRSMIEATAQEYASSDDSELRAVAKSYSNPNVETTDTGEERYRAILYSRIDNILDKCAERLTDMQMEELRSDCRAACP